MKKNHYISAAICLVIALCAFPLRAQGLAQNGNVADTLFVYCTWEGIFDEAPDTILVNPVISADSPTHFDFEPTGANRKNESKMLHNAVAVALGDSVWFVNAELMKKQFKGDCKHFSDFVPLYFNSKIAFAAFMRPAGRGFGGSLLDILFGIEEEDMEGEQMFYLIDFESRQVRCIDHKELSSLLERYDYRDLQRRFESMHDYREQYIIQDFFIQMVNRLNEDPTVPFLLQ